MHAEHRSIAPERSMCAVATLLSRSGEDVGVAAQTHLQRWLGGQHHCRRSLLLLVNTALRRGLTRSLCYAALRYAVAALPCAFFNLVLLEGRELGRLCCSASCGIVALADPWGREYGIIDTCVHALAFRILFADGGGAGRAG